MISLKQFHINKKALLPYLYLIGAYLIGVSIAFLLSIVRIDGKGRLIHDYVDALLTFVQIVYAIASAIVIFHDVLSRRSNQEVISVQQAFRSKVLSGLIVSLIPNLLVAVLLFVLGEHHKIFVQTSMIWLIYTVLIYFVFFCLAVFVVLSSKSVLSALVSYFIFIYGLFIILWSVQVLCIPFLYGVQIDYNDLREWMPAWQLYIANFLQIHHISNCFGYTHPDNRWIELVKEDWLYLLVLLAIGVLSLLLSCHMYGRMKDDKKAFPAQIIPGLASVLTPLAAGISLYQLAPNWGAGKYALLAVGLTLGFFMYQIIQNSHLRVFKKSHWLRLGILTAVVAISILTAKLDLFGITAWTPDPAKVKSICYAERHLNYYGKQSFYSEQSDLENSAPVGIYNGTILTRELQISKMIDIHKLHLANPNQHSEHSEESCTPITILYTMDNGRQIERYYCLSHTDDAYQQFRAFERSPAFLLNIHSLEEWKNGLKSINMNKWNDLECTFAPPWDEKVMDAIYQDVIDGNWIIDYSHYPGSFRFEFTAADSSLQTVWLRYTETAANTLAVIEQYKEAMGIEQDR